MEKMSKIVMGFMVLVTILGCQVVGSMALCNVDHKGLEACFSSISGANPAAPTTECCDATAAADLPCLCSYKDSAIVSSFGVDTKLAMELPSKCNIPCLPTVKRDGEVPAI